MASANLSLNVTAVLPTGTKNATPPGLNFGATPGKFDQVNLPSGNTTVNLPPLTNAVCVVVPPTVATVTVGTIPLTLSSTEVRWMVIPVSVSFVVNASAPIAGVEVYYL